MTTADSAESRLRAYAQFVAAVLFYFVAVSVARHSALGLVSPAWRPLIRQGILVFLLLAGYASMGFWFNRQLHPIREQGLPLRKGWLREAGIGLAVGWAVALICVLPMVLAGGIAILFFTQPSAWGWLAADAAFFALFALAEEVAFRGYAFQRFVQAVGPLAATLGFAAYYAVVQSLLPGASVASFAVAIALSLVLSAAYLRTRALWVSWGINFGWKAGRALIFGLAVMGLDNHSPVIQGNPMSRFWLSGGSFGLDGSWISFAVLLAALPLVFRVTRELDFLYNAPELIPAGIPVDIDAAARAQYQAAQRPASDKPMNVAAPPPAKDSIAEPGQIGNYTEPR